VIEVVIAVAVMVAGLALFYAMVAYFDL